MTPKNVCDGKEISTTIIKKVCCMDIEKAKRMYEEETYMSISERIETEIGLSGIQKTIEHYCIMRDALWIIAGKLNNGDATDVSDAIAVIENILFGLRGQLSKNIKVASA